jgi:hypothetical protein
VMDAHSKIAVIASVILAVRGGHVCDAIAAATSALIETERMMAMTDSEEEEKYGNSKG